MDLGILNSFAIGLFIDSIKANWISSNNFIVSFLALFKMGFFGAAHG